MSGIIETERKERQSLSEVNIFSPPASRKLEPPTPVQINRQLEQPTPVQIMPTPVRNTIGEYSRYRQGQTQFYNPPQQNFGGNQDYQRIRTQQNYPSSSHQYQNQAQYGAVNQNIDQFYDQQNKESLKRHNDSIAELVKSYNQDIDQAQSYTSNYDKNYTSVIDSSSEISRQQSKKKEEEIIADQLEQESVLIEEPIENVAPEPVFVQAQSENMGQPEVVEVPEEVVRPEPILVHIQSGSEEQTFADQEEQNMDQPEAVQMVDQVIDRPEPVVEIISPPEPIQIQDNFEIREPPIMQPITPSAVPIIPVGHESDQYWENNQNFPRGISDPNYSGPETNDPIDYNQNDIVERNSPCSEERNQVIPTYEDVHQTNADLKRQLSEHANNLQDSSKNINDLQQKLFDSENHIRHQGDLIKQYETNKDGSNKALDDLHRQKTHFENLAGDHESKWRQLNNEKDKNKDELINVRDKYQQIQNECEDQHCEMERQLEGTKSMLKENYLQVLLQICGILFVALQLHAVLTGEVFSPAQYAHKAAAPHLDRLQDAYKAHTERNLNVIHANAKGNGHEEHEEEEEEEE